MDQTKTKWITRLVLLMALTMLAACPGSDDDNDDDSGLKGEGIFRKGCPEQGRSVVHQIDHPDMKMEGPDAIGTVGDYLLMNSNAAFIIEAPENINAYYLYGGILVDAVALDGCNQAGPEQFEEIGFLTGDFNIGSYYKSTLRAFRGDNIEVINDGSNGEAAVVRVTGVDDYFWIVELELVKEAFHSEDYKNLSDPLGIEIAIDYILPPDSNVLQVDVNLINTNDEKKSLILGVEVMFGDTTNLRYWARDLWDIIGFKLDKGLPWMSASGYGDGAWALSFDDAEASTVNVSGVTAILDYNQLMKKLEVPAGAGQKTTKTYYFSVGPTDSNSAVKHFYSVNPEPIEGLVLEPMSITGKVLDSDSGAAVVGALVELQAKNESGKWSALDSFFTNGDGAFGGDIPKIVGGEPPLRFVAKTDGRPDSDPVEVSGSKSDYEIPIGPPGSLKFSVVDKSGGKIPAKILLYQDGSIAYRIHTAEGDGVREIRPGDYHASVSRGYEYTVHEQGLTIAANQETSLDVTLDRAVDTSGFLSVDTHIHASPSADNFISIPERIRTVAAEGLEIAISTEHEYIADWSDAVVETGLTDWVSTVPGQEVTATMPEHTIMFPVEPDFTINARGGFVPWYGKDLDQIFAAERARGADITQLNHPSGYLQIIDYDVMTGMAQLDRPELVGFDPSAKLWSWNFNTIELMNDPQDIFAVNAGDFALFDVWMSFINLGHTITAVGVSDAHNFGIPGRPRNYFPSSTDDPSEFVLSELVEAMTKGKVIISAGAYADVKIDGSAAVGEIIADDDGSVDISLKIQAIPEVDVAYFKVYLNCDQVGVYYTDDATATVKYIGTVSVDSIDSDAHIVIAGFGENHEIPKAFGSTSGFSPNRAPRFITNPIYIDRNGNGTFEAPGGKMCIYDVNPPPVK